MRRESGQRPRVAVLTPVYPPDHGGIERLAQRLSEGFTRLDPSVITLASVDPAVAHPHIPVLRVPNRPRGGRRSVMRFHRAAAQELLRRPPDVVLSMHVRTTASARAAQGCRGVPFVQYVHAKEIRESPEASRFCLSRCDRVIGVSRFSRDLALEAGADPASVVIVPNGVDPVPEGARPSGDARPTLVSVSRLQDRYKGHDTMLEALVRIRTQVPDVRWIVIGDGVLRPELERRAVDLGVDGAVTFLGAATDRERDAWLERAHAFVLPTREPPDGRAGEGFGIVFLEAAAHALPVVAGRVPGVVDAVEDGVGGHLVDPTDADAVAAATIRILTDRRHADALGRAARQRSLGFAWDSVVGRVEDVLLDAIAHRRRSRPSHNRLAFARELLTGPDVA